MSPDEYLRIVRSVLAPHPTDDEHGLDLVGAEVQRPMRVDETPEISRRRSAGAGREHPGDEVSVVRAGDPESRYSTVHSTDHPTTFIAVTALFIFGREVRRFEETIRATDRAHAALYFSDRPAYERGRAALLQREAGSRRA
ncbi:hypothetical protein GCM10009616_11380 [Microlunatus lacustris]